MGLGVGRQESVVRSREGKSEKQNDLARLEAEPFEIEERKCKGFESLGSISQRLFLALFWLKKCQNRFLVRLSVIFSKPYIGAIDLCVLCVFVVRSTPSPVLEYILPRKPKRPPDF